MEILEDLLTLSIGGLTIGTIVIYLGKMILNKSSELLIENHKNKLEIAKTEHQIKFSQLHTDRGQIIRLIYQDLYDLEKKLEHLTSLFQGPDWTTDTNRDKQAIDKYKETKDHLEQNRIYFSDKLCEDMSDTLEHYLKVIEQMLEAKNKAKFESGSSGIRFPKGESSMELWQAAEKKAKNELVDLRLQLAERFRKIIEV